MIVFFGRKKKGMLARRYGKQPTSIIFTNVLIDFRTLNQTFADQKKNNEKVFLPDFSGADRANFDFRTIFQSANTAARP